MITVMYGIVELLNNAPLFRIRPDMLADDVRETSAVILVDSCNSQGFIEKNTFSYFASVWSALKKSFPIKMQPIIVSISLVSYKLP